MLTKNMFWATVAVATAAASVFAWLMIKATPEDRYALVAPPPPASTFATPTPPPPPATIGKLTKSVGLNLQSALDAIKRKEFANARSYLSWAEDATGKTPVDNYKISEVWAYFYGQQQNYKGVLIAYQDMITHSNQPQFPAHDRSARPTDKTIGQLAAAIGDYPLAIAASERWLTDHPDDREVSSLLTQSYYSIKNYPSCRATAVHAVAMAEQANQPPPESWLQFMRSCADSMGDQDTAAMALEKLCQYFPKPDYWQSYIRTKSRNTTDFANYYWRHLSVEAVRNIEHDEYSAFAQQSLQEFNLPASGARSIEQGIALGLFPDNTRQRSRIETVLKRCLDAAQSARNRMPLLVQEAPSDPTGQKDFELGLAYFDQQQFDSAITSLGTALRKGRFARIAQAQMTLGIAQLHLGARDNARAAFQMVTADEKLQAVAQAWTVRTYN
jgi:tetratricopeptide (TPR) repeat protein